MNTAAKSATSMSSNNQKKNYKTQLIWAIHGPNQLTLCSNQFKSPGVKILCVLYLHYNVTLTFKWHVNYRNKTCYPQRVWIGYNIELANLVYWKNEGVNNYQGAPRRNCYILDKKVLTSISFDLIQTQPRLFLTLIQILVIAWLCEKWWACTLFTELLLSCRPFLTASQVNQFWNCWLTRGIPLDTPPPLPSDNTKGWWTDVESSHAWNCVMIVAVGDAWNKKWKLGISHIKWPEGDGAFWNAGGSLSWKRSTFIPEPSYSVNQFIS